jgi:hypothetical protein
VTFLCNAQLGLSLAIEYLEAFENEMHHAFKEEIKQKKMQPIRACAGIAMVKMHYPFSRAYDLSERLCKSAKGYVRKDIGSDLSALDWHFATSGLSGSLRAIRDREYKVSLKDSKDDLLTMRPLLLYERLGDQSGRFWRQSPQARQEQKTEKGMMNVLYEFQNLEKWTKRRNKVIGLRQPLRQGPDATEKYRFDFDLPELPAIVPGSSKAQETGWTDRCVYFDAIELLDHYVPLQPKKENKA